MLFPCSGVLRMQLNLDQHDPEYCVNHLDWVNTPNCTTLPVFESKGPTVSDIK